MSERGTVPEASPPTTRKQAPTEYVVLRADLDAEQLQVVTESVIATSSNAAIKATATTSGAYVAVPLRSFKPVSVVVESKPSVQIGELA